MAGRYGKKGGNSEGEGRKEGEVRTATGLCSRVAARRARVFLYVERSAA